MGLVNQSRSYSAVSHVFATLSASCNTSLGRNGHSFGFMLLLSRVLAPNHDLVSLLLRNHGTAGWAVFFPFGNHYSLVAFRLFLCGVNVCGVVLHDIVLSCPRKPLLSRRAMLSVLISRCFPYKTQGCLALAIFMSFSHGVWWLSRSGRF